jgi:hypothetical protein
MNPETEEKQKNRPLNRKFLLRGVVICVFLALLPFAGIKAWKQSLFFFNKSLWEQNYPGDYLIYYSNGIDVMGMSDDELWQVAQECLSNFGCEISYSQETYLPQSIRFNSYPQYFVETFHSCDDLSDLSASSRREEILHDCQRIGFEPITNNE